MRSVLAIASLTLRGAVRSRVLLVMLAMLAVAIVGIPLTVKGDGTVGGQVQVLLGYSLGFAGLLLSVATVWSGCAAVSTEVEHRQIHLVVTKPVHAIEIWLGKWLGLLALNAVLLAFSGAVVYGLLRYTTRPAALAPEEERRLHEQILVARAQLAPAAPKVDAEARRILEEERQAGRLPPDTPADQLFQAVRQNLLIRAFSVDAGQRATWDVRVPFEPAPDRPIFLQFRFNKSQVNIAPVPVRWVFGDPNASSRLEVESDYMPNAVHTVRVPREAVRDGQLPLTCENLDTTGAAVFFDPDTGLQVLLFRGSFLANFVRALLVLFCRLSFLAALGLGAGALLSLPVAAFAAISLSLIARLGGYLEGAAGQGAYIGGPHPSWGAALANDWFRLVFRAIGAVVRPLAGPNALDLLSRGRLVPWADVGRMFGVQTVLYGAVLAVVCSWLFRRRELGLPGG